MSLRIGKIEYANCVPLFGALRCLSDDRHQFVPGVPAVLNARLSRGEIDLCISSSIIYGADPQRYWLLPGLSISATGPVRSVLLFSLRPLEDLDGCKIALTTESDTSVALLRIILGKFMGFSNEFHRTDKMPHEALDSSGALLLIGDQAMRESMNLAGCHLYDLGELWFRFTGLPFVYALWIVNRLSVAGRENQVSDLAHTLLRAKVLCRDHLSSYVKGSGVEWYGTDELISYWQTISYDLGRPEIKGVTLFFRYAAELGIIEQAPVLSFLPGSATD